MIRFKKERNFSRVMKIKVVVDSCGDLPDEVMEQFGISLIPLNIEIGKMLRDRIDITPQEYYANIDKLDLPNTSAPNFAQWEEMFDEHLKDGYDKIVVVTLSSKFSNTYQQGAVAAKKFYPKDVHLFDSLNASGGEGLLGIRFAELLKQNYELTDVLSFMENMRPEVIQIGYMDSLKMLVKSGRISRASEFFASLGRMKPMIITQDGENIPLCRVISLKNAKKRAVEEVLQRTNPKNTYSMLITHADSIGDAIEIEEILKSKMKVSQSYIGYMGPVVGSRVGPGGVLIAVIPDKKPE